MQTTHQKTFTTVRTEGALLPPDLLARVIEGDPTLKGLTPQDYHLLHGERINEATNRAWNRAIGAWATFQSSRARWSGQEVGTSETRERWLLPLLQELGYGRLTAAARAIEVQGKSYPVLHVWGHVPIHLVGAGIDLDQRTAGVAGAARTSPHGVVQELLSTADDYLWGFVSNGLRLRILRDSTRLSRQAYVEFDLEAMMDGEIYADFVLLWLLCQESRVEADRPQDCWLEQWALLGREQGTRVREHLRSGVQQAIEALGRGFLAHPANGALRERLRAGHLEAQEYYHELLRLVYRLLFLFVAEDRDALLDPHALPEAQERYHAFYSTRRLRQLASRQRGSRHSDLYAMLRLVLGALGNDQGAPGLGLPFLGSFLFATGGDSATPSLDGCTLANRDLLEATRALAFVADGRVRRPVDFKNLGTEELGSVYEALLELHPELSIDAGVFSLAAVRGNERKTTGSYYTPESLTAELIKTAVDPVLEAATARGDAEAAILNLKICDPAAGSGHFLLAAARRLAKRLAQVRTGDAEPAPRALQTAVRDVISECIYGVDVNPMAVELCKVSLWMEAVVPGKPLNFLDHHIKCGNSLIGATPTLLEGGIPDEAFDPVTGDDKAVARELKRLNKEQRESAAKHGIYQPLLQSGSTVLASLGAEFRNLGHMRQDYPDDVRVISRRYTELKERTAPGKLRADAWCAAFFWAFDRQAVGLAPTTGDLIGLGTGIDHFEQQRIEMIGKLAEQHRFFHWHLEFPDVLDGSEEDGFDCVLGNPPWEQVELKEEEFFAVRSPNVLKGHTGAERKHKIEDLATTDPELYQAYIDARLGFDRQRKFLQGSKRYPLTGRGRTNLYSVFAECGTTLSAARGKIGMILPWGIATDDGSKEFFGSLVSQGRIASAYLFANERKLFAGTHHSFTFGLFTFVGRQQFVQAADFATHLWRADEITEGNRHYTLTAADFALISPNTHTLPIFRSRHDAELTRKMYHAAPVMVDERGAASVSPWEVTFRQGLFNMTSGSHLFRTRAQLEEQGYKLDNGAIFQSEVQDRYVPLYEAKLFHQFDHRFATFEGGPSEDKARDTTVAEHRDPAYVPLPRYWVPHAEVEKALGIWRAPWLLAFRDIARSTDERTFISTAIPRLGANNKAPLLFSSAADQRVLCYLLANLNSLPFDYAARQKIGATSMNFFIVKQLPVLPPAIYERRIGGEQMAHWITRRVLELSYTSYDMVPLARDFGYDGPPFHWDRERRAFLRGELDGMYAHLYGLSREDFAYILSTFPVLQKNEERKYGEYRTARLALAAYDGLTPLMSAVESNVR